MEFEFDKEMDSLLRQTARGEIASANSRFEIPDSKLPHLDADEISAFAEDALPEKAKQLYTAHFADCDRCRKILANVILLNSEATSENVHAPKTAEVKTSAAPWYRQLFAVPNLAYAMGALILIFGGLIAFTFLKSDTRNTEVSQMSETPVTAANANFAGQTSMTESNAAMSNSASMQSNMSATNSAPVSVSNASMSNTSTKPVSPNSNAATASNKKTSAEGEKAKAETPIATDSATQAQKENPENQMSDATAAASLNVRNAQPTGKDEKRAREDNETVQSDAPAPPPKPAQSALTSTRSANDTRAKKVQKTDAEKGETRVVGGKTFKRENGVWYEAAYGGQGTTNITRGSEDFKKLDVGLRSIADAFGGTVVVVWKGKAYRIQ